MRPLADLPKEELLKMKKRKIANNENLSLVNHELRQRELEENIEKLTKPHWTFSPTFWLVVATSLLTLISTAILIFQFLQSFSQEKKSDLNKSPAPTNLQQPSPTVTQPEPISQPTTSQVKKKNSALTKK